MGNVIQGIKLDVTGRRGSRDGKPGFDADCYAMANPKGISYTVVLRKELWERIGKGDATRFEVGALSVEAQKKTGNGPILALYAVPEPMGLGAAKAYGGSHKANPNPKDYRVTAPYRSFSIAKESEQAKLFPGWPEYGLKVARFEVAEIETGAGIRQALVMTGWQK